MAVKSSFNCTECGHNTPKWLGRCPNCQQWGTIAESLPAKTTKQSGAASITVTTPRITEINPELANRIPTGIAEFDRVVGSGLVTGSVTLLAGEPGVGKSTLLLAIARSLAEHLTILYVTGEESPGQIRIRAERTHALHPNIFLAAESDLAVVLAHAEQCSPHVLIIDSVQTLSTSDSTGQGGGVNQIKAVTSAVTSFAKATGTTVIIVGHVTKDGLIAGPRTLEHLVDVVLHFEGERHSSIRVIRGVKNRYGASDEFGCFEQHDHGIRAVADPATLFLHNRTPVSGTAITVTMDGKRALLAEVQALLAPTNNPALRRSVSGLDAARLAMILAVLDRRCKISVLGADVYAATVGGMKLTEPSVDLAIAVAAASAATNRVLLSGAVVIGEVGLAGEVRSVRGITQRLHEAARLGFTTAIIPRVIPEVSIAGLKVVPVETVSQALAAALDRN